MYLFKNKFRLMAVVGIVLAVNSANMLEAVAGLTPVEMSAKKAPVVVVNRNLIEFSCLSLEALEAGSYEEAEEEAMELDERRMIRYWARKLLQLKRISKKK